MTDHAAKIQEIAYEVHRWPPMDDKEYKSIITHAKALHDELAAERARVERWNRAFDELAACYRSVQTNEIAENTIEDILRTWISSDSDIFPQHAAALQAELAAERARVKRLQNALRAQNKRILERRVYDELARTEGKLPDQEWTNRMVSTIESNLYAIDGLQFGDLPIPPDWMQDFTAEEDQA